MGSGSPSRLPAVSAAQLKSFRRLRRRKDRDLGGRFVLEGRQAVAEALAASAPVSLVLLTDEAADRHPELVTAAADRAVDCRGIRDDDLTTITDTVTPAGIVGLCHSIDVGLETAVPPHARLVLCGARIRDPGNAGTMVRCADAAGADAVIFGSASVDLYNPKTIRASTGSIFHLPVVRDVNVADVVRSCRERGFQVLAASGSGAVALDEFFLSGLLSRPTVWLFGNEAHGLSQEELGLADQPVRVPIYGHAESLNLASAAAICLYASAFAFSSRAQ